VIDVKSPQPSPPVSAADRGAAPIVAPIGRTLLGRRSLVSEAAALLAVANKEWLIFRRYPGRVLNVFIWPILAPLAFIFSARALSGPDGSNLSAFREVAGTSDYDGYLAIGITFYMWLNFTLWSVGFSLREEQLRGTLESNWLCPVWRVSILLGGALTRLATALVFIAIAVAEFWLFFGISLVRGHPWLMLLVLVVTIPSIYGFGIAFGSLVLRFREANALVFIVRGIFMVFCGTTYPTEILPGWMQTVSAWLPLTYTIHAMRLLGAPEIVSSDVLPDLTRLVLFAVVLPVIGVVSFRATERRSRQTGSLGQF
jgi:ABC-2 type transport system permease protein